MNRLAYLISFKEHTTNNRLSICIWDIVNTWNWDGYKEISNLPFCNGAEIAAHPHGTCRIDSGCIDGLRWQ